MLRRLVALEGALVEFLRALRDGEGEHLAVRAGALQAAVRLVARLAAAEMDVEREHAGVALHDRGIELERERVPRPVLRPDIGELRAGSGEEVVHAGGEALRRGLRSRNFPRTVALALSPRMTSVWGKTAAPSPEATWLTTNGAAISTAARHKEKAAAGRRARR